MAASLPDRFECQKCGFVLISADADWVRRTQEQHACKPEAVRAKAEFDKSTPLTRHQGNRIIELLEKICGLFEGDHDADGYFWVRVDRE